MVNYLYVLGAIAIVEFCYAIYLHAQIRKLKKDNKENLDANHEIGKAYKQIKDKFSPEQLIEDLAELEHDQWVEWSKNLDQNEKLSEDRIVRWKNLWVKYKDLTEEQKEQDRVWARKVLEIMNKPIDDDKEQKEEKLS